MTSAVHRSAVETGQEASRPPAAPSAEPDRTAMGQGISATAPQSFFEACG